MTKFSKFYSLAIIMLKIIDFEILKYFFTVRIQISTRRIQKRPENFEISKKKILLFFLCWKFEKLRKLKNLQNRTENSRFLKNTTIFISLKCPELTGEIKYLNKSIPFRTLQLVAYLMPHSVKSIPKEY